MRSDLRQRLVKLGPFLGLLAVVVFFAIASGAPERYLSTNNLRVVLAQTVIVALGAIGMTLVIVGGGIDLSVGSVVALTGVITALAIRDGYSPGTAVVAAVAAGGLIGLLNGLAVTRLRVVPFIATLGMLGVARGTAKWLANQSTVNPPATWVNELAVTFPPEPWMLFAPGVWVALVLRSRWRSCCGAPCSAGACSRWARARPPRARAASRSTGSSSRSTPSRACCSASRV
jgi:ribose transport system permease protein